MKNNKGTIYKLELHSSARANFRRRALSVVRLHELYRSVQKAFVVVETASQGGRVWGLDCSMSALLFLISEYYYYCVLIPNIICFSFILEFLRG